MGRMILWAGWLLGLSDPVSLDRWNHCTPSSRPHSWLPALSPAAVPWLALPLLAQGAGAPRKRDGGTNSQSRDSHRVGQGSPASLGCPQAPGARL